MIARNYYRKEFWKNLSSRSMAKFLFAVFFTFASMGFITDLWSEGQNATHFLVFNVLLFGIMGMGYAYGATRNWKWIPVLLVIHLSLPLLLPDAVTSVTSEALTTGISKQRLIVDGFGIMLLIMLGYAFFVIFITGEGIPHIRLKTEIELARRMQDILVPDIRFNNERMEIFGRTESYYEIGGDLIDIYHDGDSLIAYTADVSGHGVGASLLMGMFKSAMRTALQKNLSLAEIINDCNRALQPLKNPNTFLTLAAIKFKKDNRLEYCVAGHLPILHFNISNRVISYHGQKQIPVSVKKDYNFVTEHAEYQPGDVFIFLSDGIIEVRNKKGQEYGQQNIEKIMMENYKHSAQDIYNIIIRDAKKFGNQMDDQSLMVIRLN